jgi:hypothetical protein
MPRAPIRRSQRIGLGQILNGFVDWVSWVGFGRSLGAGWRREAIETLEGDNREKADMHVGEQFPFLSSPSLRENPPKAMAEDAGGAQALIRYLLVLRAAFGLVER